MNTEALKNILDAHAQIMKILDVLESIGLQAEPNDDPNSIGNLIYNTADKLNEAYREISGLSMAQTDEVFSETVNTHTNHLYEVNDGNGSTFYICIPIPCETAPLLDWMRHYMKGNMFFEPVERITEGFSYHLVVDPGSKKAWDIYLPLDFEGRTDDAILEWYNDYFSVPANYIIKQ